MFIYNAQALLVVLATSLCLWLSTPIPRNADMDKELTPYIDRFVQHAAYHYKDCWKNRKIDIRIAKISDFYPDVEDRVIGVCNMFSKKIIIDINFFKKANEYQREAVIFHELGHCFLDRGHTEEMVDDDRPISIMHPILLSWFYYVKYHDYYVDELFENSICD